ncbi:hypothetical protein [Streptomyces hainanensis]|uniref:Secreted protein n=1 Tax=Streptomyces hainanensis TaxID=402648 RepID=A0A4V2Y2M9_9ACTN|nr:hypothetical protein [Streptomyces hainanensis]TDC73295.1 hypothetical protein E1283_19560 [Streptomyces hainanensis]
MSAISVILLVTAGSCVASAAFGALALRTALGLRRELGELRAVLAGRVPVARPVPPEEIRTAVAAALADERERELAEARAYWAEQDARESEGAGGLLGGRGLGYEVADADEEILDALLERYLLSDSGYLPAPRAVREGAAFLPRQADDEADGEEELRDQPDGQDDAGSTDSAELAAARRRHPSHPGFTLTGEAVERGPGERSAREEQRHTADRLSVLAESRTPLADVRQGPMGTLDLLLFEDGTTLCLTPSHQEAAERLAEAVRTGETPVLMGGSGVSGAYALTFACGAESVYLLADRVVASTYRND